MRHDAQFKVMHIIYFDSPFTLGKFQLYFIATSRRPVVITIPRMVAI